jgi:hypothetical protein
MLERDFLKCSGEKQSQEKFRIVEEFEELANK